MVVEETRRNTFSSSLDTPELVSILIAIKSETGLCISPWFVYPFDTHEDVRIARRCAQRWLHPNRIIYKHHHSYPSMAIALPIIITIIGSLAIYWLFFGQKRENNAG